MSIMEYNGGAVMAMVGKDCVAIASDTRFGVQQTTLATNYSKIFPIHDRLYVGLAGLTSDIQTLSQRFNFRTKLYKLREERDIAPKTFSALVSSILYERRFGPYFVEPVIAGIDQHTGKPFISSMDLIGCPMETDDFVLAGTAGEQMYGMAESLWKPDLAPDDLFETISQALLAAVDRDCLSGWGGVVHIIEKDKVTTRYLKGRMD